MNWFFGLERTPYQLSLNNKRYLASWYAKGQTHFGIFFPSNLSRNVHFVGQKWKTSLLIYQEMSLWGQKRNFWKEGVKYMYLERGRFEIYSFCSHKVYWGWGDEGLGGKLKLHYTWIICFKKGIYRCWVGYLPAKTSEAADIYRWLMPIIIFGFCCLKLLGTIKSNSRTLLRNRN